MAFKGVYDSRVGDAHAAGDLHVHGLGEAGGLWVSWDSSAVGKCGDVASFVSGRRVSGKASRGFRLRVAHEWNRVGQATRQGARVFLGFDEQTREDSLDGIMSLLRSMNTRLVVPLVAFTDEYDWETTNDLAAFDAVNSLCSPIFIRGKEEGLEPGLGV
jgi:hypothetical protein